MIWHIEYVLEVAAVDGVVDGVGSDVGVLVVAGRRHARLDLDRSPECTLGSRSRRDAVSRRCPTQPMPVWMVWWCVHEGGGHVGADAGVVRWRVTVSLMLWSWCMYMK